MDAKYGTNPAVRYEWSDSGRADPPLEASVPTSSRSNIAIHDIEILDTLEYAFDLRSKAQIHSHMVEECSYDRQEASERLDELIESELILPEERVEERRNWFEHGWDISLYYHLATREWSFDRDAEASPQDGSTFSPQGGSTLNSTVGDTVELPSPASVPDEPLNDILLDRRTCRDFDGSSIGSHDLSSVLYHSLTPVRDANDGKDVSEALSYFDTEAFPLSVYPVVTRSDDLGRGLYRYRIDDHSLASLEDWTDESSTDIDERLQNIVANQPFVKDGSVTLFFAADVEAIQRRYADAAALRHLYAAVSVHVHRILLTANTFGFDAFQSAALKDSIVDELLGVDGYRQAALYFVTIGGKDE